MCHIFRQFFFIIMIAYAISVAPIKKDYFKSIFLRVYLSTYYDGNTTNKYVDYLLEDANMIPSRIIKSQPTVMCIHGFTENVEKESVQTVVQAYLKRNDHNIIAVDYGILANDSYAAVVENVPRIANVLATALNKMAKSGFDTEKLHIIGHSLGGHISGYIGRKVDFEIPRITGLDPAGFLYNLLHPQLSISDARFVDIIYTDYGFHGIAKIIGTVNFFPNGGKRIQPGCPQHPNYSDKEDLCNHQRAWKFYAESLIDESAFLGVQCSSLSDFKSGKCNNNTQIVMGYATPSNASGIVYLVTNDHSPFGLKQQGIISN